MQLHAYLDTVLFSIHATVCMSVYYCHTVTEAVDVEV